MKRVFGVASDLIRQRSVIWSLARRDFRHKYVRNLLGIIWAVIDPIAFVGILYLIFSSGFGNPGSDDVPFILYILCGNIAFDLFNNLQHLTQVIKDHEFLVKKMNFKTEMLPASRLISCLMLHGIVVTIAFIMILLNGIVPTIYWFQLVYYTLALSVLLFGLSMLTSSISLFFPDISQIIAIVSRVLFFLTPVFWKMDFLPEATEKWLKLNPMVYIVNGYRDSLLYGKGCWLYPQQTIYFWILSISMVWIGTFVHRKLRPHFAEVI
jgi:ABC-type polysaccharide/polyol phosphate export permease